MKIYNIVKGQLITIWVFGITTTFISLVLTEENLVWLFLSIFIPCLLIFYTIGWKNYRKTKK